MILYHKNPLKLRQQIRAGNFTSMTSGLCSGYVQCNLVILEKEWAEDFYQFCKLNPKPCPVIYKSKPGEYQFSSLGEDIDIRTDISSLPCNIVNCTAYVHGVSCLYWFISLPS